MIAPTWGILGGRQRAAPNIDVRVDINRLFTPLWGSYFVTVLGGGTKTVAGVPLDC